MRRNTVSYVVTVLIGAATLLYARAGFALQDNAPAAQFSHPDRIRYDSHSIIIDGKPVAESFKTRENHETHKPLHCRGLH